MNKEAQEVLNKILVKDIHELTEYDKEFLRARRSYLKKDQAEKYKKVLRAKNEPEEEVKEEVTLEKVQFKARSLGIAYKDVSKEDLLVAISTIEGPESASKPE